MELLFEYNDADASAELNNHLGFIDADIKYSTIKPDVITATNELVRFTGQPVYNAVLDAYKAAEATEAQALLVYMYRYPIAIRAYALLAPNNDISHTENGRKMRATEYEKQAFEWMIDRDNEALERRYYRAMDDLVHHLDANSAVWQESDAFKKSHRLFLRTTDDFDMYFPIQSRYVLMKLEPGIRQCEQNEILPRIGKIKFDALKAALQNGEAITDDTDVQLLELAKEACVYYALSWAMVRLSVTVFPEGILQSYTSDRETTKIKRPAAKLEAEVARTAFTNDAFSVFQKIEALLAPAPDPLVNIECNEPKIITGDKYLSL